GLGALLDEGLDAAIARHADCGRQLQDGLEARGYRLFAADGYRLAGVTTVGVAGGVGGGEGRAALRGRDGSGVGGGVGEVAGKVWRIGCMGHTARPRNVSLLLAALDEVIGER